MKTRIIYTKIWDDSYIGELNVSEKLLFIYLISNSHIGLLNIYECPDRRIAYELGLTNSQLQSAKKKLESDNKFYFKDGYVFMVNGDKYNQYKGEKNEKAREDELSLINADVVQYFDRVSKETDRVSEKDDRVFEVQDTSINHKSGIINHKSKIINKELGIKNQKLQEIVKHYNNVFQKNMRSVKGFKSNYEYWSEYHDISEIKTAIENARVDRFWKDKMTLSILFRRKNKNGEDVDYIEDLQGQSQKEIDKVAFIS